MVISKKEQIQQRRTEVWKLHSKGLTQEEIAIELKKYNIPSTQQTISLDLKWLKEDSDNFVQETKKHIAEEYRKVITNFEELRRLAWKHYNKLDDNSNIKAGLYDTILAINNNIMTMHSISDVIDAELKISAAKNNMQEIKQAIVNTKRS